MPNRSKQLKIYVTEAEMKQLKEWKEQTGKSLSELGREAILEYTDHDRTRRIEEKVDQLLECIDHSEAGTHTHTNANTNSVPETARAVVDHIYSEYEAPIKDDDVEIAIENIAGVGDERSIDNYKSQFKKRGLLYEHPNSPVWTDDKTQWVTWVENATVDPDINERTEPYKMTRSEYIELAEEIEQ
jgi:hypothetical protein